eukprot:431327-Pyramimonas_sp.AAC.1
MASTRDWVCMGRRPLRRPLRAPRGGRWRTLATRCRDGCPARCPRHPSRASWPRRAEQARRPTLEGSPAEETEATPIAVAVLLVAVGTRGCRSRSPCPVWPWRGRRGRPSQPSRPPGAETQDERESGGRTSRSTSSSAWSPSRRLACAGPLASGLCSFPAPSPVPTSAASPHVVQDPGPGSLAAAPSLARGEWRLAPMAAADSG